MVVWKLNEDDAWDIVYQTLYKAIDKADSYEFTSEKRFSSFLFVMFCNYLTNMYNKKKRIKEQLELVSFNEMLFDESGENPALRTEREVQKRIIKSSMEEQEESKSESVMLRFMKEILDEMEPWERILLIQRSHNTPYKKIADFIEKPVSQLKVYHQRLRAKLVTQINEKIQSYNSTQWETQTKI